MSKGYDHLIEALIYSTKAIEALPPIDPAAEREVSRLLAANRREGYTSRKLGKR